MLRAILVDDGDARLLVRTTRSCLDKTVVARLADSLWQLAAGA